MSGSSAIDDAGGTEVVEQRDVVVVGAGPAGTAAAIELARAGVDAVVLDRATFPRDKICGDGLTTSALRQLDHLGLDPRAVPSWQEVSDCWISSPSGVTLGFPLPEGQGTFAVVARRVELDAALVDLARASGAELREDCRVVGVEETDDRVRVRTDDGVIEARWCIAADGMWSTVRKHLGLGVPGYRGDWHAFRQYFRRVSPAAARSIHVRFEADLLPGYFWSFPLPDGGANVGFGIQRGAKVEVGDMGPLWQDLLARPWARELLGPDAEPEGPHRAWPIPARIDGLPLTGRRTLFVGDAAAACDTLTGEGIGQALQTGRLAAAAVADTGSSDAAATYAAHATADLVADHRMSELLVRAMRHRKGARTAIRVAGATAWTRRNFARWLFEDYPRAVVLTPRRWRRGVLSSPGAYVPA